MQPGHIQWMSRKTLYIIFPFLEEFTADLSLKLAAGECLGYNSARDTNT